MSSSVFLGIVRAIEGLYESVVDNPGAWSERAFADWANDTLVDANELPRDAHKEIRRALRMAQKLQGFWSTQQSTVSDRDDWESKVDIALGPRAWRPLLDLARIGLSTAPSEELFEQVKVRFALVNSDRWMDGTSYEEWASNN